MHSKSDNMEIMSNDKVDEVIEELFESLLPRYQIGLETLIKCSEFIFDCVSLLYYRCNQISFNRGGSYIDSLDWIKSKKASVNLINKNDNKCFQYAIIIALNHEEIKKDPKRILKIKPFINKCNWKGINYSSRKNVWKMFVKNNSKISLMYYKFKKNEYIP